MATIGQRELRIREASLLADLFGIQNDLESARRWVDLLLESMRSTPPRVELWEPLSTAILVRYSRCFCGGVRTRLGPKDVRNVGEQWVEFHQALFELRQKHIAHSVNEFEENVVTISVTEKPDPPAVHNVGLTGGRLAALQEETAARLAELIDGLLAAVKTQVKAEELKLNALVAAWPIAEVYALPEQSAFSPSWSRVAKRRPSRDT